MFPILFSFSGLTVYSYPLFWGLAWGLGIQFIWDHFKKSNISPKAIIAWILGLFISSWFGAKVLFILTSDTSENLIINSSFWYGGGFVFLGGLFGALIFVKLYGLFYPSLAWINLGNVVLILLPCHALGRVGCFLAGCCYGQETNSIFGISFHGVHRYPTQLLEAVFLILLFMLLFHRRKPKENLAIYMMGYGVFRFFLEYLRGDSIRGLWGSFTPSQWMSLVLLIMGFLILRYNIVNKKRNSQVL